MTSSIDQDQGLGASAASPPTAAFVASPSSPDGLDQRLQSTGETAIPNEAIEQFCADLQRPLEGIVKKFCEQAYETILGDVQFYLGENAVFNIGSKFDAQQRETVSAYKALAAVENATTLREAQANAYAARKGYWSEERAAEYRAESEALAKAVQS